MKRARSVPVLSVSLVAGLLLAASAVALAQFGDVSKVKLKAAPVAGTVSVLEGVGGFSGGNIGVFTGEDGVLVVDDGLAGMGAKLKAQVALLSKKPIRYLINTHMHFDHTGSNAEIGRGVVLLAHDSVRKRLAVPQVLDFGDGHPTTLPAHPASALPAITFGEDVTLHFNGDEVHVVHMPPAHTDGDVVVHFVKANVLHTGDLFINQALPVVDPASGGRFQGLIDAATRLLTMCNDTTKVIPGHGPVGGKADLVAWREMLIQMQERVGKLIAAKKTVEEIKAAHPLAEWEKLSNPMIKTDLVIRMIIATTTK